MGIRLIGRLVAVASVAVPAFAVLAHVSEAASGLPPVWAPSHQATAAGHVDTIRGNVEMPGAPGTLVVAVDSADDGLDGQVDQVFVFRSKEPLEISYHRGPAEIEFWRRGMRLALVNDQLGYRLELEGQKPPELRSLPIPVMAFPSGKSLCTYGGPVVEALTLGSFTLDQLSFLGTRATDDYEPEWADPGSEGGGCAKACSTTCKYGSCSVSCGAGCATCVCNIYDSPICHCQ